MNVRNCRQCGRIYNYIAGPNICPSCREKTEEKFQEVKEYIRGHRGASIPEVAEECDVEPAQIRQWLREDRLELTEESAIFLNCEGCGCQIRSGRFCDKCAGNMTKDFKEMMKAGQKPEPPKKPSRRDSDNPKMRFL